MPICGGRPHPPRNREQRVSAVRPQSRNRCAFLPRDFVGLAAFDANRVITTQEASALHLPVSRPIAGSCATGQPGLSPDLAAPMIEFAGVSKRYGNAPAVLDSIDL